MTLEFLVTHVTTFLDEEGRTWNMVRLENHPWYTPTPLRLPSLPESETVITQAPPQTTDVETFSVHH